MFLAHIQMFASLTHVKSISGVLVLSPCNLPILVLIVVFPVLVHVFLDVSPLPVFNPVVELHMADETIFICIDTIHNLSAWKIHKIYQGKHED